MSRPVRIAAWFVVLLVTSAGLWLVFRPASVPCDIAEVDRGPLTITVDEDGRTRLKDRYVVSSPLSGLADRITLKPGNPVVAAETILARIAPSDPELLDDRTRAQAEARVRAAEAAVARAEPELARCEAELEHVRAEFVRYEAASRSSTVGINELEDERIMLRAAEQAVQAARFALEMYKYELEQAQAALLQRNVDSVPRSDHAFEIRSPVSGKVLRVFHESLGAVVPGDPLVEVGSLAELEVEVDVLSDQAVRVRPGQRVRLERWGGEMPLVGAVRIVEPSGFTKVSALGVEEQRVNVIIDFLDPPEHRATLGDGFRVEARIIVLEKPDVVRVPVGALVRHSGGWAVYTLDEGMARLQSVTIGERSSQWAEVLTALAPGDRVIIFPSDRVSDGVRVHERGS